MTNLEARVFRLETRLKRAESAIDDLTSRVGRLEQSQWMPDSGSGGGDATGVFVAVTGGGGIGAASAAPGGGTPGTANLTIYRISSGAYASVGAKDIYNPFPDAIGGTKLIVVSPNGDGTYTVVSEACGAFP